MATKKQATGIKTLIGKQVEFLDLEGNKWDKNKYVLKGVEGDWLEVEFVELGRIVFLNARAIGAVAESKEAECQT